jgi:glucose-1-phosphate thymidylyltransferase
MKGIVLAGGVGSRLYPITQVASKQLQPVYDKPLIYYPLATLIEAGINQILVITTPEDVPRFRSLLGSGGRWGVHLEYAVQESPGGIAQAFLVGDEFIGGDGVALILGDNIFFGDLGLHRIVEDFTGGGVIFGYPVTNPQRYGVVEVKDGVVASVEEKPAHPRSNLAIPGLYLFDAGVVEVAGKLRPSSRGELEITDVHREYLRRGELEVRVLGQGIAWLDCGTHDSLLAASNFIATIEARQGLKIACLEEVAYRRGLIGLEDLAREVAAMPYSTYREYLETILQRAGNQS